MISENAMNVLRTTSLFAGFNEEQLEMVPKVGMQRKFASGERIVEQGTTDIRSLWLLLEGEVDVVVGDTVLQTLTPGSHFGEMALLTDAPRSADVVARTEATVLELSRSHLNGLIGANPQVAMDMLAELATRLRRATEALEEMTRSDLAASPESKNHEAIERPIPQMGK